MGLVSLKATCVDQVIPNTIRGELWYSNFQKKKGL